MVKQQGFLAETLVGIAVGLGVVVILVSLWVSDSSRRAHELEGMLERSDLDAATFYLPLVTVQAHVISIVSKEQLKQAIGSSEVQPTSSHALKLMHPFSTTHIYLGFSQRQQKSALWVHKDRFGNTANDALLDASGELNLDISDDVVCLGLMSPEWIYCHHRLPGQSHEY